MPAALWFATALLPDGWADWVEVSLADGMISAVAVGVAPGAGAERHGIGLPGLGNAHSHAFQRGFAGLAERGEVGGDFWSWRAAMYRFVDRLGPAEVEAIAAQAFVEMLEAGFTRVGEFHYLHHGPDGRPYADPAEMAGRIAAAAGAAGIGLTLLAGYYVHGGFAAEPGHPRFVTDADGFARIVQASRVAVAGLPGAVVGVAPHSLRAVRPGELAAVLPLAEGGPVHIHVAEQTGEVEACLAWCGRRPVALLLDTLPVDGRWCLVHATHVDAGERRRLAASGAVVGLCPITEANLGDGVFPAADYRGAIAVGTDSNVQIDAAGELRLLEYGQRLTARARGVLAPAGGSTGRSLFDAALAGGGQALGAQGGIAVGRPADLVSLRADHPGLLSREADGLLDAWVFAGSGMVDRVWARGRLRVADGRHVAGERVLRAYAAALRRVLA